MTFLEYLWEEAILLICKIECFSLLCKRKPGLNRRYLWRELMKYAKRQGGDMVAWAQIEDLLGDRDTHVTLSMEHGLTLDRENVWVQALRRVAQKRITGNDNCRYFSGESYLKCAVNPCGDCAECPHFEPKSDE